jgi:hypothetical protein
MGLASKITNFARGIDAYGTPVTFLYKRNETYKTCFGGIVTIVILLGCLGYANYQMSAILIQTSTITVQ